MFGSKPAENSMNLPVGSHIDRLAQQIASMKGETDSIEKELQILRGNITQLSYINKEADQELNLFLIDSIAGLRNKWGAEWDSSHEQLRQHKKRLSKLTEEQEDVDITREEMEQNVFQLEEAVGLR